ncbi:hypothetical protein ACHAWO_004938 [Cyclotella atomus]|uniref:Uncharacterized protein n=1 Tax=Cyclotella atomus TaxID=382360 RepID=A0ABD3NW79_9STRA
MTLFANKLRMNKKSQPYPSPAVMGDESIMSQKAHGTSHTPVQENLRWKIDTSKADKICNFNRHDAEHSWYYRTRLDFVKDANSSSKMNFYDSNTGKPLFVVGGPDKRTIKEFLRKSALHGWSSFRDDEVNWEHTVITAGTHLGHNLPDKKGSRYCINLVSIAGRPTDDESNENDM